MGGPCSASEDGSGSGFLCVVGDPQHHSTHSSFGNDGKDFLIRFSEQIF